MAAQEQHNDRHEHLRAIASKGGRATFERYGSDYMRELQRRSWAKQLERNPHANMRLGYAGLRSMDPAAYNGAWQRDWSTPLPPAQPAEDQEEYTDAS